MKGGHDRSAHRDQGVPELASRPHRARDGRPARLRRQSPGQGSASRGGSATRRGIGRLLRAYGARQPGRRLRGVLDALASALQLDEAERDHLFHLARQSGAPSGRRRRRPAVTVRPALQQVLDAITDAPAWIRNGRYDVLAMNQLGRALYSPVLADPRRPANTARFVYLHPESSQDVLRRLRPDRLRCGRDAAHGSRPQSARRGAHRLGRRIVNAQ